MTDLEQATRDLPAEAIERLREMQGGVGLGRPLFTSDLSVNEFLLVDEAGFDPVGLVMGSSFYHVGIQVARWSKSQELNVLTQAMYHARELAMERMEAEAAELKADGIVGVRLDIHFYEWGGHLGEFMAVGTAVKARKRGTWKAPSGRPFTSDLSGQDFWTLLHMGYRPISLVLGNCVYHVAHRKMLQTLSNTGRNLELPNFTQALYTARELAMERMQQESRRDQADGVVGVRVEEKSHVWGHHAIEFLAIGTAVAKLSQRPARTKPGLVLNLG